MPEPQSTSSSSSTAPASAVHGRPALQPDLTRYGSFSRDSSAVPSRAASPPEGASATSEPQSGSQLLTPDRYHSPPEEAQEAYSQHHLGETKPQERTLRRWTKSTEHLVYRSSVRDSRRFSSTLESEPAEADEEDAALLDVVDPDATASSVHSAASPPNANVAAKLDETPYGVQKIQAITARLRRSDLKALYFALYTLMFTTALESSSSPVVEPYFLSSFNVHSLLASIGILTNIGVALIRPLMAKILDIFGRAEGIALSALLYSIGYVMIAGSQSVITFAIAKTVASFGAQGLHLSLNILIADTTSLSNRALVSSSTSIPWFLTIWIGPPFGQMFLSAGIVGYRTLYGLFALLVPCLCAPMVFALHRKYRKITHAFNRHNPHEHGRSATAFSSLSAEEDEAGDRGHGQGDKWGTDFVAVEPQSWSSLLKACREQLDLCGIALLCAGGILILLPLSLSASEPQSWKDLRISGLILLGILALYAFVKHENSTTQPFMPRRLLDNKTIRAGCLLGCFHFICQFTYESYFTSFLQVARNLTARDAQYIQETYLFSAVLAALICGLAAKYSRRYKVWGVLGVFIHMVGAVMMVRFRKTDNPLWEIVASQIIGGIGGGLTTCASQLGIQAVVPHQDVAMATAVLLAVTQVGAAIGASMSSAMWTGVLPAQLQAHLPIEQHHFIPDILGSLTFALSFEPGTPERTAIDAAYGKTQYALNLVALISLLPALYSVLSMQNVYLTDERSADAVVVLGRADQITDTGPASDSRRRSTSASTHMDFA